MKIQLRIKMMLSAFLFIIHFGGNIVESFTTLPSQTCQHRKVYSSALYAQIEDAEEAAESVKYRGTLLNAIGFTAYGSRMIYEVAELRRIVNTHSHRVRQGKPAKKKKLFGIIPRGEEEMVTFNGSEKIFSQPIVKGRQYTALGFFENEITAEAVADFMEKNADRIRRNEKGDFELMKDGEPASDKDKDGLYQTLEKLKGEKIRIVAFDDQFQDSELIYAIAIDDSKKRVSLVFRGSVTGTQDWPTNLNCGQIPVKDLVSKMRSDFIKIDDAKAVSDVKLHRGFAQYLFAPLDTDKPYRLFWSKFDKIVLSLKSIYEETDENGALKHADFQLCVCGHSLGGALAQLIAFALGSSEKCRHMFPLPILAVTYASPCVGNEDFSKEMYRLQEKNILRHVRFTNEGDLVPGLFSLPVFNYTQSGCNFHVREGQVLELGGFSNTKAFHSQLNIQPLKYHDMDSYQSRLFCKVDDASANAKVWRRYLEDSFMAVKKGMDLSLVPDKRPYEDRYMPELKEELATRGLKTSGRKVELVERLEASDMEKKD